MNRLLARLRPERGSTLIAVVLVLFVAIVVGTTTLQVARHANDATTVDRERVQAVQAAEAGVNQALDRLELNGACDPGASASQELRDGSEVVSTYRVRIDPEAGTSCDTLKRVIEAWGYASTGGARAMRHLEVQVQLLPQEGFQFTLFASGSKGIVAVKNTGTIDGDIYAESLDQTQNNVNADKVITPGSIETKDNAVYSGVLWAGGNVTLGQNASVGGSVLAAGSTDAGNVVLENGAHVAHDVRAAGSVNLPTGYTIEGSVSEGNPNIPPPPVLEKPAFSWDGANYSPAPNVYSTAAELEVALEANKDDLQGTYYTNDPNTYVTLPKHAKVTGPLTIVTTGKVDLGRTMTAVGGPWQVVIVAQQTGTAAIDVAQPATFDSGLDVLLYTKGDVNLKNQITMRGSVYADAIQLKNKVTIERSGSLADSPPPGFDFSQSSAARFTVVPTLWREVVPGDAPA